MFSGKVSTFFASKVKSTSYLLVLAASTKEFHWANFVTFISFPLALLQWIMQSLTSLFRDEPPDEPGLHQSSSSSSSGVHNCTLVLLVIIIIKIITIINRIKARKQ